MEDVDIIKKENEELKNKVQELLAFRPHWKHAWKLHRCDNSLSSKQQRLAEIANCAFMAFTNNPFGSTYHFRIEKTQKIILIRNPQFSIRNP